MWIASASASAWLSLCCSISLLLGLCTAWDINDSGDRHACQKPSSEPLQGCDQGRTLLVSQLGGGGSYKTVQSAVAALPNNTETYTILIAPGIYTEQVNVTRPGATYLLGQTLHPTSQAQNTVNITWAAIAVPGLDNAYTATLTVAPNLNASLTGSGPTGFAVPADTPFGCVDFRVYNVDFVNDFAPYSDDPSLALSISYANGGFYYSGFYSYQDTIYVGKLANAYFHSSTVAGQTDFLYGFGTAWITHSTLLLRSCGGGITAWKGTNTTFPNAYGIYITHSSILAANSTIAPSIIGRCALGRPWNSNMRAIVAQTYLDASILPTGYIDWNPSRYDNYTLQAEYENYGPGWNLTAREGARFDKLLTRGEWAGYDSPDKVFMFQVGERAEQFGNTAWIDEHVR